MQNVEKTIDCTPTWEGLLPTIITMIETGLPFAKQIAKEELHKMACAADKYNQSVKGGAND